METKNLTIETLSPIFIWKGENYSKFDYTLGIDEDINIKIYDINKLICDLPKYIKNKDKLFEILNNIEREMKEGNNFDILTYLANIGIKIPEKQYLLREYKTRIRDFLNKKDIKPFISQFCNGKLQYYIPGSSIKGAINTALIYNKIKNWNKEKIEKLIKSGSLQPNKHNINISIDNDRYFISDANIEENMLDIFKVQRFYVYHINKNKIGTFNYKTINYIEGLKPYQTINLKIKCNKDSFDKIKKACNELSLKICEWELKILNKYKNSRNYEVYKDLIDFYIYLKKLKKEIENNSNNAIFINIGWGGGYLPKTIYILAKEKGIDFNLLKNKLNTKYKNKKKNKMKKEITSYEEFPFTRTITKFYNNKKLKNYPLGWIKIEG